jgi:hypothetical protein
MESTLYPLARSGIRGRRERISVHRTVERALQVAREKSGVGLEETKVIYPPPRVGRSAKE